MKTLPQAMALVLWANAWVYAEGADTPNVAPKEIVFKTVMCKTDCGPHSLKFKAIILNNSNDVVSLEKFALKTRLTLSYQPNKSKKNKGSKKSAPENYKTISISPGGAYSEDSIHLNPSEIYGIDQKLNLDSSDLDVCSAKSIKVYGNIPILFENKEREIAVNQDLKNDCDL